MAINYDKHLGAVVLAGFYHRVSGLVQTYFFNDDVIPTLTNSLNEYIKTSSTEAVSRQKTLTCRKSELQSQKANIVDAIAKTGYANVFDGKLREIESELQDIQNAENELAKENPQITITEDMVRQYLGEFRHYVKNRDIPQIKRFIDSYVERVEVFNDNVKVTYKVAFTFCGEFDKCYSFEVISKRSKLKSMLKAKSA